LSKKEVCTHILSFVGINDRNLALNGHRLYINIFLMMALDSVLLMLTALIFTTPPAIDCTDLFKGYWQIEVCTLPPQKEEF